MTLPLQVLVLEDRKPDAELVVRELEKTGFVLNWQRVDTLRDFRLRLTPNLDLILADYTLPGFTVVEALAALKESKLDVPILVVSGSVGDDKAVECLKMGATDYILKDRMARLGPAVRRALAERASMIEVKRSHEALAASEQQMRGILSTVEDVVWSMSLHTGKLLYLNPAAEKLTGRPVQQFLDDPLLWLQTVHPDDQSMMLKAQEEAVRWGTNETEYRMVRMDGTIRNVAVRAWTAYDAHGKPAKLEGILTDVTGKRDAERERIQSEIDRRESARLAQLSEFKSHFIAMVAHDLNNVLTPMKINVHLIGDELTAAGNPDSKPLRALSNSVTRLEGFLADLLDASRLQSGQLTLAMTPFDLASSITASLDAIEDYAAAEGVTLVRSVPVALVVKGDRRRLEQVSTNLLSNAVKFTPSAGQVKVSLLKTKEGILVSVTDSGRGIAAEDIAKLFQPFGRLGTVPQGKHSGTGLGLFICKGIVEQHGGRIWCESDGLGRGTTFNVLLPPDSIGT